MDVLYIVGNGSKWDNWELRYSLRSICRYCCHVSHVYICSEKRWPWLADDDDILTFVPFKQPGSRPAKNVFAALSHVIKHTDIADDFLLANDDYFYIRGTDLDELPFYTKGQLPVANQDDTTGEGAYKAMLRDTARLLASHGLPTTNFSHHCFTHFNRSLFLWAEREGIWAEAQRLKYGASHVTIMANIILYASAITYGINAHRNMDEYLEWLSAHVRMRKDVKIKGEDCPTRLAELKQLGVECFSIYDSAVSAGVADYLAELFPKPCYFER